MSHKYETSINLVINCTGVYAFLHCIHHFSGTIAKQFGHLSADSLAFEYHSFTRVKDVKNKLYRFYRQRCKLSSLKTFKQKPFAYQLQLDAVKMQ